MGATPRTDTERLDFLNGTRYFSLVHNPYRGQWAVIHRCYPEPEERHAVFWERDSLMWAPDARAAIDLFMDREMGAEPMA